MYPISHITSLRKIFGSFSFIRLSLNLFFLFSMIGVHLLVVGTFKEFLATGLYQDNFNDIMTHDLGRVQLSLSRRVGGQKDFIAIGLTDQSSTFELFLNDSYRKHKRDLDSFFLYGMYSPSEISNGDQFHPYEIKFFYHRWDYFRYTLLFWFLLSIPLNLMLALINRSQVHLQKKEIEYKETKAIAQITQMLAHDVRKPFSLLIAMIDMVKRSRSVSETKEILGNSIEDVNSALNSVNGMLADVMEMGKGKSSLSLTPCSPQAIISVTLKNIFRFNGDGDYEIEFDFNHKYMIKGDPLRLERVFSNIVGNAVEHMKGSGKVWFKTTECSGMTTFCIGNSDTYIPEEDRKKLFEAFYTKDKVGGTGLGLAIVKKVVEAHTGSLWCQSSETDGTEFYFTLPTSHEVCDSKEVLYRSSKEYFEADQLQLLGSDDRGSEDDLGEEVSIIERNIVNRIKDKVDVVIVDDDNISRKHVRKHLAQHDDLARKIVIHECLSVEDVFVRTQEITSADVFVLDIDLGDGHVSGLEGVNRIKERFPEARICLHSNHKPLEYQKESVNLGADLFLPKPMPRLPLLKILGAACGMSDSDLVNTSGIGGSGFEGKIVFIEDTAMIRRYWKSLLGDQVLLYSRFIDFEQDADRVLRTDNITAIVTDYFLESGHTGLDVAKVVKKMLCHIPVILCSSADDLPSSELEYFEQILPKDPKKAIALVKDYLNHGVLEEVKECEQDVDPEVFSNKSILVVEDERSVRRRLAEYAKYFGEYVEACSYGEAMKMLSQRAFDVLLSDIHLTKRLDDRSQGYEVMKEARKLYPNIAICSMSTDSEPDKAHSMDHFVEKPFKSLNHLLAALTAACEKRSI